MHYTGSCHCGAIQFTVALPDSVTVQDCNCSICSKAGFLHLIVPTSRFTLLQGADNITTYTFNTGVAKHTFCKTCGMKPFYTPRSNPDGIDINVRCLDSKPPHILVETFDGQNWEQHAGALQHLSQD